MLRYIVLISSILLASCLNAQLVLEKRVHDFGQMLRSSQNWVDIPLKNNTAEEIHIFRVEQVKGFEIQFSNKRISPGYTEYIRIAYTPSAEGSFKYKLPIYTSAWQEPEHVIIKGESTFAASTLIPCPAFGAEVETKDVELFIEIVDSIGRPINDALVSIKAMNSEELTVKTNEFGQVSKELAYGPYYISASKENFSFDTLFRVNALKDVLILQLNYQEIPTQEMLTSQGVINSKEEIEPLLEARENVSNLTKTQDPYPSFSLSEYKPNNLVFLVDVSTSMKKNGKMELLKEAMIQLLELLRPVDRFALISYSTSTEVLLSTEGNLDKQACIEAIRSLEPGGNTAGAKALKKAREVSLQQFLEDGNNEVFLATDGAFNGGVDKALKESRKMDQMNVKLSVLGIKCGPFTTKQMKELISEGEGGFIPVSVESDGGLQLIEQVKKNSAYN